MVICNPPPNSPAEIIGYAEPWTVSPGDSIDIKVRGLIDHHSKRIRHTQAKNRAGLLNHPPLLSLNFPHNPSLRSPRRAPKALLKSPRHPARLKPPRPLPARLPRLVRAHRTLADPQRPRSQLFSDAVLPALAGRLEKRGTRAEYCLDVRRAGVHRVCGGDQ
jgi:hypothetical protein